MTSNKSDASGCFDLFECMMMHGLTNPKASGLFTCVTVGCCQQPTATHFVKVCRMELSHKLRSVRMVVGKFLEADNRRWAG
jgi:hypothetical protein